MTNIIIWFVQSNLKWEESLYKEIYKQSYVFLTKEKNIIRCDDKSMFFHG